MVVENDRRKSFDVRLAGRQKYRARSHHRYFRKPETRLPRRGPDRRQTVRRVSRPLLAFVNKYRTIRKKIIGDRPARIDRRL